MFFHVEMPVLPRQASEGSENRRNHVAMRLNSNRRIVFSSEILEGQLRQMRAELEERRAADRAQEVRFTSTAARELSTARLQ